MIAEVIVHARTVRTLTLFDYHIPDTMTLSVGDMVYVPFRTKRVLALVWALKESSAAPHLRSIEASLPLRTWHASWRRGWLTWFAQWHAISLSHAFKTLQHTFPKRITATHLDSHLSTQLPLSMQQSYTPHLVMAQRYGTILAWYAKNLRARSGHTLILCPDHRDGETLYTSLPKKTRVFLMTEATTPKKLTELERQLTEHNEPIVVIGSKKLLSLDLSLFTTIIIDQEESSGHKQRDLNPRYHVRRVVLNAQAQADALKEYFPRVVLTSIAPSIDMHALYMNDNATREMLVEKNRREPHVRVISMHEEKDKGNYSWFSEESVEHINTSRKALLFLNRTGEYSYTVCADCAEILTPQTTICAACQSVRMRVVSKGIAQLEVEARTLFTNKRIARIDRTVDDTKIPELLKTADIIFATEKIRNSVPLSFFDYICILSVDHLLSYPQYRAHERTYQLLRYFFSAEVACDLQTHSPTHPVIVAASTVDYDAFANQEARMRTLVKAPPYGYRARVINTRDATSRIISTPPAKTLELFEVLDPEY